MEIALNEERFQLLMATFINNLPAQEQELDRLVYHLRLAYFYYLDHLLPTPRTLKLAPAEQAKRELQFLLMLNDGLPEQLRLLHREVKECLGRRQGGIVKCGAIVSYSGLKQKRYLVIKDRKTGKYGFPKGKIAEGQTLQQCAERETREETNYRFLCSRTVYTVHMFNHPFHFYVGQLHHIRAERERCEGKNYNEEVAEILWVTKDWLKSSTRLNAPTSTVVNCINIFGTEGSST